MGFGSAQRATCLRCKGKYHDVACVTAKIESAIEGTE